VAVVRERVAVGTVEGCAVYRLLKVALLPVGGLAAGDRKGRDERTEEASASYRKAVKQLLQDGGFYFSYAYDLTNS